MVLNPNIVTENKMAFDESLNPYFDPLNFIEYKTHKETPEQYKARKESMAQRKVKKETLEEYESRKAYMKEKAIKMQKIEEQKYKKFLEREELKQIKEEEKRKIKEEKELIEKEFGPKEQLTDTQLSMKRHNEKIKREDKAYQRKKAFEAREERRKLGGPVFIIDMPKSPKFRMSWNVEGN
jgi:hypothetical protein